MFWHCYGLLKCKDETVSTLVCMCNAPSTLELDTWSSCRLRCSSSTLYVLSKNETCWLQNIKKNAKIHIVTTFHGRAQQRDCVCREPCTSCPLAHLCAHDPSQCFRVPLSSREAEDVFSERVSHFAHCTKHGYSLRPTKSPRQVLQCFQDSSVALSKIGGLFPLQLSAAHPRLVHPPSHHSPRFQFGPTPGRSIASAVGVCEQVTTSLPGLRASLRMYKLQP